MVRTELTTTRIAGLDTYYSTTFTILLVLVLGTQCYIWTKLDTD